MYTPSEGSPEGHGHIFRLFIAGDEPNSKTATENLRKLCESRIDERHFRIEVVNVLESYSIALENNIFITPALIMVSPEPAVTIFGDLSNTQEIIKFLRLGNGV